MLPPQGGFAPVLMTNFGFLFDDPSLAPAVVDAGADGGASRKKYGLVCEESFGGKVPERFVRHPDGRLLLATFDGVYAGAADGCGFQRASGTTAFQSVPALAVDLGNPQRVWALTRTPPALHQSLDGGRSFMLATALPPELRPERLYAVTRGAAGATSTRLYIGAYTTEDPLVVGVSDDGGATITYQHLGKEAFVRPNAVVQLDGPAPDAPNTLFAASGVPDGPDEIWRSTDGGERFVRVLTLGGTEVRAGLAFGSGARAGTVYVAGRELFPSRDAPAAHLYVSRDGGTSFGPGLAVPPGGPTFRCLEAAEDRLYACGGGVGDTFLFGVSDDEGQSWTATATITDIAGPRACTSGRCLATATWLCDAYGVCSDDLPKRDAQPADVADVDAGTSPQGMTSDDGGCGCRIGGAAGREARPLAPGLGLALLLGLVRAGSSFRCHRHRRRRSR